MVECTFVEVIKTMKRAHLASLCLISVLPRAGAQSYKCFKNDPSQAGKMDLFVSTFITEKRGAENNRYPRIDIFNYTLQTYSRMPIDRAFFFLTIDDEHKASIPRLNRTIHYLFAGKLVHLQWSRLGKKQEEYVPWIQRLCTNGDRLVLFTQNDDHIYVDYDASYLQKGLELMRSDYSLFKTMYISHWPELLRVCTKLPHNDGQLHGDFIRVRTTVIDSIQIFNAAYLNYLFVDFNWHALKWQPGRPRLDGLIYDTLGHFDIWTNPGVKDKHIQTMWVPLREQCRKFNGYSRSQILHPELFPPLMLPPETNLYRKNSNEVRDAVTLSSISPHSAWYNPNGLNLNATWIEKTVNLYKNCPWSKPIGSAGNK